MKLQSLSQAVLLPDGQEDRRSGVRLGQYRLSAKALYWPNGDYLPLSAVTEAEATVGSIQTKGCCGLALPTPQVSAWCDGKKKNILFDSQKQVDAFLAAWRQAR